MVLGADADVLGGLMANSTGWLGASDETHCGKMATLKVLVLRGGALHVEASGPGRSLTRVCAVLASDALNPAL
jgi:hypothetical protein